jgi:tagatose 1,6-diphosphate aldolase
MEIPPSVGKIRGLQQIADVRGIFAMCAMDHRGSMREMIDPKAPEQVSAEALAERKLELAEILGPVSTAVLLDPIFGAAQAIISGVLPGRTGLIVSLEESGYERGSEGRLTTLIKDWSVERARRMGASAVKVLLYYRPDLASSQRQREIVAQVSADCIRWELPFVLEPLIYQATERERDPAILAARRQDLVITSARELTALSVDVLKAQFPVDTRFEQDTGRMQDACRQLDAASRVPWVLLSAGVSYDEFTRQVIFALQAGASGFLGGRAVWEEGLRMLDGRERRKWLETVGVDRMRRLHDLAGEYGAPWNKRRLGFPQTRFGALE